MTSHHSGWLRALAAGILTLTTINPAATAAPPIIVAESRFDTNTEGWTIIGDAQGPFFNKTGGHPGGALLAFHDGVPVVTNYLSAPGKFLGNLSGSYGRLLSYDLTCPGDGRFFQDADVILVGANQVVLEFRSKNKPPRKQTKFKNIKVLLKAVAGWKVSGAGRKPTEAEFRSVLAEVTALEIRGDYNTGQNFPLLDNVVLLASAL
jgi:hypothetical protein